MGFPRVDGVPKLPIGSGTALAAPSGVLHVSTTQEGTDADTDPKTLWEYPEIGGSGIPANTMSADGKVIRVWVRVRFAANGNTKTVNLVVGGTSIQLASSTFNNTSLVASAILTRINSTTLTVQRQFVMISGSTQSIGNASSVTVDFTGDIALSVTAQNGTASADDIVFHQSIVESLN